MLSPLWCKGISALNIRLPASTAGRVARCNCQTEYALACIVDDLDAYVARRCRL